MAVEIKNKTANRRYFIQETLEAGIELKGTEVKSIREGNVNLKDSFVLIRDAEAFIYNLHISVYKFGNYNNHDPLRTRKLLLHSKEIKKIYSATQTKGMTVVPVKMYFNKKGFAKVLLGLGKGKTVGDKRDTIKDRDAKREVERAMKRGKR